MTIYIGSFQEQSEAELNIQCEVTRNDELSSQKS